MFRWQPVMSTMFLVFATVVLYGASQGWFSKKLKKQDAAAPAKKTAEPVDPCRDLRDQLARAIARNLELQQEIDRLKGSTSDAERKVGDLMDTINRLTLEVGTLRTENAKLKAALRAAQDDYAKCRRDLANCNSELLAKRIGSQACNFVPENANLIR